MKFGFNFKFDIPVNIKALFAICAGVIGFSVFTIIIVTRYQDKKIEVDTTSVIETSMSTESAYNAKYYLASYWHYAEDYILDGEAEKMKKVEENFNSLNQYINDMTGTTIPELKEISTQLLVSKESLVAQYKKIKEQAYIDIKSQKESLEKALYKGCQDVEKNLDDYISKMFDKKINAIENMQKAKAQLQIINVSVSIATILLSLLGFLVMYLRIKPISQIIHELSIQADMVDQASKSVGNSAEELQATSHQQSSAAVQTAAALEEINQMANRSADFASNLKNNVDNSTKAVSGGTQMIEKMLSSMDHIQEGNKQVIREVNDSNSQIKEILGVISDIAEKTKVINDIVFQTKLLSFNASVEAARAGDAGKGFAVVAQEIGNLAAMSGQAAQAISTTLATGLGRVEKIIEFTKEGLDHITSEGQKKINEGSQNATECGKSFDIVSEQISQVNIASQEIFHAIKEQSLGLREISSAISVFDKSSHQNAIASEKTLDTAKTLLDQAQYLNQLVADLNTIATGKRASQPETIENAVTADNHLQDFNKIAS